jgi:hypothetical protein
MKGKVILCKNSSAKRRVLINDRWTAMLEISVRLTLQPPTCYWTPHEEEVWSGNTEAKSFGCCEEWEFRFGGQTLSARRFS